MLAETYYKCEKIDFTSNGDIIKKNEKFKIVGSFEGLTALEVINKYGEKRQELVYDSDLTVLEKSGFIIKTEYNPNDYLKKECKFNIGDMVISNKNPEIKGIVVYRKSKKGGINEYEVCGFGRTMCDDFTDIPEEELELVEDEIIVYDYDGYNNKKYTITVARVK